MVLSHIKNQPGFENENVDVKELPTKTEHLKNFLVTALLQRKDEMYEESFWPAYGGIRRFKPEIHETKETNFFYKNSEQGECNQWDNSNARA